MLKTRWKKVFKDLWSNKARTSLVVLSITIGVFAVGLVGNAYLMMLEDMNKDHQSVNPYSGQLYTSYFTDGDLNPLRKFPEVNQVEGRTSTSIRVQNAAGNWIPLYIIGVPDLDEMQINQLRTAKPNDPPLTLGDKEILIERTGAAALGIQAGDSITIETTNGKTKQISVSAITHDVTAVSMQFSGQVTGYVNLETMQWLGGYPYYDEILFTVEENTTDETYITGIAEMLGEKFENGGGTVFATVVYNPGEHYTAEITRTLLMILLILGLMAVLLSGFLVVNTINALLTQHIRQIGLMKAVGAKRSQIIGMYLGLVGLFGLCAFLLAVPLSTLANYGIMSILANMLNYKLGAFRLPILPLLAQFVVAFLVPLVAGLMPVLKGSKITVREALNDYGLNQDVFGETRFDRMIERLKQFPRPLLISIRNTFRRKGRLILTLSTLTLAGAIFIAVFNVKSSFDVTIQEVLGYFLSDVNIDLDNFYHMRQVEDVLGKIDGVKKIENWGVRNAKVLSNDQITSTEVIIWAPPNGSELIKPVLTDGRWLLPEDHFALVVGNHFLQERPEVKIGDQIVLQIEEKEYTFTVVGNFLMAGTVIPPFTYTNADTLTEITGGAGRTFGVRIVTSDSSPLTQRYVADQAEKLLPLSGIGVGSISTGYELQQQQLLTINILIYCLLVMASLIAVVGGVGLAGTMSMNIMERTREIGVMRSIGATNRAIRSMVMVEGVLIGLISWVLGTLFALPISKVLANLIGVAFVQSPLTFRFSLDGFVIWMMVVILLSAVSSLVPANHAVKLTVRDILAYE